MGTNLVEYFKTKGHEVINVDIASPRNPKHLLFWREADICDTVLLRKIVKEFAPENILHMAARTDLNGFTLDDYRSNTEGVRSLIEVAKDIPSLKRVVFASSMLVCPLGYQPKNDEDFCPKTIYGQSKVVGEQLVRSLATSYFNWIIVRPTSLWGPWFGTPYKNFFDAVAKQRYMHPKGKRIKRSYGFVLNATDIIDRLISYSEKKQEINGRVFYLADYEPIELFNWATKISKEFNIPPPREVPLALLRGIAKIGDGMKVAGISNPPLSSFRLDNLLTDAVYDMATLEKIVGPLKYNVDEAICLTVDWIKYQQR